MFKKFKNLAKALFNAEELLNAQVELEEKKKEISNLKLEKAEVLKEIDKLRNYRKISVLSNEEINDIANKKIDGVVNLFIDKFNRKLNENVNNGNMNFNISFETQTHSQQMSLDFLLKKIEKDNIIFRPSKPVFESTGAYGSWVTHVYFDVSKKYNSDFGPKLK